MPMIIRREGTQVYAEYVPDIVTIYLPNKEQEKQLVKLSHRLDDTEEELSKRIDYLSQRIEELTYKLELGVESSHSGLKSIVKTIPVEIQNLARLLNSDVAILETLLFLADKGPTSLNLIVAQVLSEDKILDIISALSRHDLVTVSENTIALTSKAISIVTKLRKNLQKDNSR